MEKDESKRSLAAKNLELAIQSVASYVERSDTLMILVPPTVHENHTHPKTGRKMFTCYRTWRRRGLCLLEMFSCFLSRRKSHPILLVKSSLEPPMWISSHECLKLAVGEANFTCCDTNHRGHDGKSFMECSRLVAGNVLARLIAAKVDYLLQQNAVVHARWVSVLEHFWTRGLGRHVNIMADITITHFKKLLHWDAAIDGEWIDREGVSVLSYAACMNNLEAVCAILDSMKENAIISELIDARIRKSGFLYFGIPGLCTALIGAMVFGSSNVVEKLLMNGANPYITDKNGNDPLMCACVYGRLTNVKFWLEERFVDWNLETRGKYGGMCLSLSLCFFNIYIHAYIHEFRYHIVVCSVHGAKPCGTGQISHYQGCCSRCGKL